MESRRMSSPCMYDNHEECKGYPCECTCGHFHLLVKTNMICWYCSCHYMQGEPALELITLRQSFYKCRNCGATTCPELPIVDLPPWYRSSVNYDPHAILKRR